ncbi:MAG: hypothetical protein LBU07_00925 [Coriobacteriales bacterium]|nr:hypothetical protein [Coriobacteriales bacterium]
MEDKNNTGLDKPDNNRAVFLLNSADNARKDGNKRLAIHLYCAAFEAAVEQDHKPDERVLSGLRQAWLLACEQGDRSTAEAIFNDLAPYNSSEQTREALEQLQGLAVNQLAGLGLNKAEIEDMAMALTHELREAGVDVEQIAEGLLHQVPDGNNMINLNALASRLTSEVEHSQGDKDEGEARVRTPEQETDDTHLDIRYSELAGFETPKAKMREFGIIDPGDELTRDFIEQAESFHGISGPVLSQNFMFIGPSREDNGVFAQATATEIGWPVVTIVVDINDNGDGTIKIMAPVRRTVFGPPRIPELPNPCTLVIQNIDILQDLFWGEEQALSSGHSPFGFRTSDEGPGFSGHPRGFTPGTHHGNWRSLQTEILSYLGALEARGGVFTIATSTVSLDSEPLIVGEELESILGPLREISIELPNRNERLRVLRRFSKNHPSFHDLDLQLLARFSDGLSRYDVVMSCRRAVEHAYSESLRNQRHQMVSLDDVLRQFLFFIDRGTPGYRHIEDHLVQSFAHSLETDVLNQIIDPNQLRIDLTSESANILDSAGATSGADTADSADTASDVDATGGAGATGGAETTSDTDSGGENPLPS